MKLVELKQEDLTKMRKTTKEEVSEFLNKYAIDICNYMNDREEHPYPPTFLHAKQLGLDFNIIISTKNRAKPGIYINPSFLIRDKKTIGTAQEVSASFENPNRTKKVFETRRSNEILLMYDTYESVDKPMKRSSTEFEGQWAILMQQLVDISFGKLITRFPEYVPKEED